MLERYSMTIGACSSVSGERRNERKVGGLLLFFFCFPLSAVLFVYRIVSFCVLNCCSNAATFFFFYCYYSLSLYDYANV
jgi:hypothetical protein